MPEGVIPEVRDADSLKAITREGRRTRAEAARYVLPEADYNSPMTDDGQFRPIPRHVLSASGGTDAFARNGSLAVTV